MDVRKIAGEQTTRWQREDYPGATFGLTVEAVRAGAKAALEEAWRDISKAIAEEGEEWDLGSMVQPIHDAAKTVIRKRLAALENEDGHSD